MLLVSLLIIVCQTKITKFNLFIPMVITFYLALYDNTAWASSAREDY